MPLMRPMGTNTAARINAIATTGPDTSCIACQRRFARAHAFLDVPLHRFDDDDRIVDDQADREHEPEQRERIDRKAEQRETPRTCRSATPAPRASG